jgi:hypothetical protein
VAHVSVYADSLESLQRQAHEAGTTGPWYSDDDAATLIPDDSTVVVERVEQLTRPDRP